MNRYAALLRDRNLLVHHGGVYTLAYLEQDASPNAVTDAFFQSKKLSAHEVANAIDFLEDIAKKLLRSSHRAWTKEIEERGISYSGERKKALAGIIWWGS